MRAQRQERDHQLGDHRHVDRNDIPFSHSEAFEHVGELRDFPQQVLIAQDPALAILTFPDQRRLVLGGTGAVAVDAVKRRIQLPANEPLCKRELPVQHLVPRLVPGQQPRLLAPEPFGIILGAVPEQVILGHAADVSLAGEIDRRRERSCFLEHAGDRAAAVVRGHGRRTPGSPLLMKLDVMALAASSQCAAAPRRHQPYMYRPTGSSRSLEN